MGNLFGSIEGKSHFGEVVCSDHNTKQIPENPFSKPFSQIFSTAHSQHLRLTNLNERIRLHPCRHFAMGYFDRISFEMTKTRTCNLKNNAVNRRPYQPIKPNIVSNKLFSLLTKAIRSEGTDTENKTVRHCRIPFDRFAI